MHAKWNTLWGSCCFHWCKKCKNTPRNMAIMVQKVARFYGSRCIIPTRLLSKASSKLQICTRIVFAWPLTDKFRTLPKLLIGLEQYLYSFIYVFYTTGLVAFLTTVCNSLFTSLRFFFWLYATGKWYRCGTLATTSLHYASSLKFRALRYDTVTRVVR